tara:strand:- start:2720 stop:3139 length:420 start_codon:yes stop_codon:yes gene_type:complete
MPITLAYFEGYVVSNSLTVKICELDTIGEVINAVVTNGGNATRVSGISFVIEDRKALEVEARKKAVEDAMAKARQLAETAGSQVGNLKSISESSSWRGNNQIRYSAMAASRDVGEKAVPIAAGEQSVRVNVNAVFSIIH